MSLYDLEAQSIDNQTVPLSRYKGQVMLIVNTASACGFTPQFTGLEKLHKTYADQGLAVLGFPCNQFASQDPGDDAQIANFCQKNYGVSFQMMSKVKVNGTDAHPLYQWLTGSPRHFGQQSHQMELHQIPGRPRWTRDQALCTTRCAGENGQGH